MLTIKAIDPRTLSVTLVSQSLLDPSKDSCILTANAMDEVNAAIEAKACMGGDVVEGSLRITDSSALLADYRVTGLWSTLSPSCEKTESLLFVPK